MAWHSGKPADSDFLSASVQHIRENFAELEPLHPHVAELVDLTTLHPHVAELADLTALHPHITELADLTALHPHVAAILDSRIVEMGSNSNGTYVRWENGLQLCHAASISELVYISSDILSYTWTFPAAFIAAPHVVVGTDKGGPDPLWSLRRKSLPGTGAPTTTSVAVRVAAITGQSYATGDTEPGWYALAIGRWK